MVSALFANIFLYYKVLSCNCNIETALIIHTEVDMSAGSKYYEISLVNEYRGDYESAQRLRKHAL